MFILSLLQIATRQMTSNAPLPGLKPMNGVKRGIRGDCSWGTSSTQPSPCVPTDAVYTQGAKRKAEPVSIIYLNLPL